MWIWEGYMNEKNREKWLAGAERLRHVNSHVLQDIEDHILLEGYLKKNIKDVKKHID
jgi:hypothetical protein